MVRSTNKQKKYFATLGQVFMMYNTTCTQNRLQTNFNFGANEFRLYCWHL